jgi:hypothetical protein
VQRNPSETNVGWTRSTFLRVGLSVGVIVCVLAVLLLSIVGEQLRPIPTAIGAGAFSFGLALIACSLHIFKTPSAEQEAQPEHSVTINAAEFGRGFALAIASAIVTVLVTPYFLGIESLDSIAPTIGIAALLAALVAVSIAGGLRVLSLRSRTTP